MPRRLITAASPRAAGAGDLAGLAGSMLPADAYARFLRARGEEVLFVSAADEHGAAAELAAREAGLEVDEYCRCRYEAQVRLAAGLGLSLDAFGRSSAPQCREQTQYFARRLDEEGFLEPRSAAPAGREGRARDGRHLFLLQSRLAGELREWLSAKTDWPPLARSTGLEWLEQGLRDRSVTADLGWGVPVERQGFEEQVYRAWFDAPVAYIAATREWAVESGEPDAWREWWRASEAVRYVQFMPAGELPLHTVSFPCMVFGSGDRWKLVDYPKAFHRLGRRGGGAPAEEGIGVSAGRALELLPADCWRYYLLANAPEAGDASFSWEALALAVNRDLAGSFGDFVHRSLAFAARHFGGEVPAGGEPGPPELELREELDRLLPAYTERMEALQFRPAIAELRAIWSRGSAYLERKRPWLAIGADRDDAELTLRYCLNLACLFARLSAPAMPFAANRVLDALAVPDSGRGWPSAFAADELAPAHRVAVPPPLFARVEAGEVERLGRG